MKRPSARFHNNPACSAAHFTQIAQATIEQSLALRQQQEEHVSEPLGWVIVMAPAVASDLSMEKSGESTTQSRICINYQPKQSQQDGD
jgi:hypothetical protein